MGDFSPKVQLPHLIKPVIRLREPAIKCASSGELSKHPLVMSRELIGNLKVRVKGTGNKQLCRWADWVFSLSTAARHLPGKGAGARAAGTGSSSLLFCILHSALACLTISRFTYGGMCSTLLPEILCKSTSELMKVILQEESFFCLTSTLSCQALGEKKALSEHLCSPNQLESNPST